MADYREGLLVEAEWLAEHLADPNVRVIEMAQDGSDFETGHIPGAATLAYVAGERFREQATRGACG